MRRFYLVMKSINEQNEIEWITKTNRISAYKITNCSYFCNRTHRFSWHARWCCCFLFCCIPCLDLVPGHFPTIITVEIRAATKTGTLFCWNNYTKVSISGVKFVTPFLRESWRDFWRWIIRFVCFTDPPTPELKSWSNSISTTIRLPKLIES